MIPWGLLGLEGIPRGCAVLSLIYMTKTDEMHSREVKVAVSLWRGTLLFKRTAEK
jgi:hypothetical protein